MAAQQTQAEISTEAESLIWKGSHGKFLEEWMVNLKY